MIRNVCLLLIIVNTIGCNCSTSLDPNFEKEVEERQNLVDRVDYSLPRLKVFSVSFSECNDEQMPSTITSNRTIIASRYNNDSLFYSDLRAIIRNSTQCDRVELYLVANIRENYIDSIQLRFMDSSLKTFIQKYDLDKFKLCYFRVYKETNYTNNLKDGQFGGEEYVVKFLTGTIEYGKLEVNTH